MTFKFCLFILYVVKVSTFVNVVDPEAIRICRTRLWNLDMDSSSTLRKHWAVLSLVTYTGNYQSVSIRTLTYLQRLTRCSWSNSPLPVRENVGHGQILTSFWRFQTPSLWVNSSWVVRHLGRIRHSKPHMLKRRLGLSLLYTETKLSSHRIEVTDRGSRFLMSQNTARPL